LKVAKNRAATIDLCGALAQLVRAEDS